VRLVQIVTAVLSDPQLAELLLGADGRGVSPREACAAIHDALGGKSSVSKRDLIQAMAQLSAVAERQEAQAKQTGVQKELAWGADAGHAAAAALTGAEHSWAVLGGIAVGNPVTAEVDDRGDGTYEVSYEIPGCAFHVPPTLLSDCHRLMMV
jgi:hypothetical protein